MTTRQGHRGALQSTIDAALGAGDPITVNRAVTEAHYLLGQRLRETIGPGSGANFHSWATWGSRAAGRTIARRDLPALPAAAAALTAALSLAVGLAGRVHLVLGLPIAALVAALTAGVIRAETERAAAAVLAGNVLVLDDIGRASASFVERFGPDSLDRHDDLAFDDFLAHLRTRPTASAGQDLLAIAFRCYWRALQCHDPADQHQHVLAGNLHAILHEHVRLQPHIATALRPGVRRPFTAVLLRYEVGALRMAVGRRVDEPVPPSLAQLTDATATGIVERLGGGDPGAPAWDWTDLDQRMRYVTGLFQRLHLSAHVHAHPHDPVPRPRRRPRASLRG